MKRLFLFSILIAQICLSKNTIDPELVDIQKINATIIVDLFWTTQDNFFKEQLYPDCARAYIDKSVAYKLDEIQKELRPLGLGLKVKDAYRPLSVQIRLWELVLQMNLENPFMYISDPNKEGGRHPRGVAVDLTLINLETGEELPMPPFGFVKEAHQGAIENLTQEQIDNREFLKGLMIKHGLMPIRCEWWHYNLSNFKDYTALDLTFEEIIAQDTDLELKKGPL